MSPEVHQRVRGIFDKALDRPENERIEFLQNVCGTDRETFEAVKRLLQAHNESSFFLDQTSPSARRFGRYVISRELGRGAMGIVYEATDPLIGRTVAIKIIRLQTLAHPDNAGFLRERLFREARSAGGLSHPGIVTIFDVGQENEVAFIAMERVSGHSLQQLLASTPRLESGKAIDILRQAADALDYAHQKGVIHRDVKPPNIMLHEGKTVKITDFGIAKILSAEDQTRTGAVMGTPSHMSPEQIGGKPLDGRSDQFSLATVAFQLLTGTEPFWADSMSDLLQKILYGPRPSARALNPELSPGVDKVLQRGLEKAPILRHGTCTEFVRALEIALQDTRIAAVPVFKRDSSAETLTMAGEPLKPDLASPGAGVPSRILAFGGALGVTAVFAVLVFFSGILPSRRTLPANNSPVASGPLNAKTAPVRADIKPSDALAPRRDSAPEAYFRQPPDNDQSARARLLYEEAIELRKRQQQAKALDFFRQAANLGEIQAMVELGETLMNDSDGVTADYPEALRWFRKAADAGSSSGMVYLGGMYLLGNGVDENYETAADWFRKAADAGNSAGMYDLGTMYENGQGVIEDQDKAKQFYSRAAALGHREARARLAELAK